MTFSIGQRRAIPSVRVARRSYHSRPVTRIRRKRTKIASGTSISIFMAAFAPPAANQARPASMSASRTKAAARTPALGKKARATSPSANHRMKG